MFAASPQTEYVERRGADRRTVYRVARLHLSNGFKLDAHVTDISNFGARLRLEQAVIVPEKAQMELFSIDQTKSKMVEIRRRWQRQSLIGVQFVLSTPPIPVPANQR